MATGFDRELPAQAWRDSRRPSDRLGCPDAAALARLLSGELPQAQADAVREHVAGCSACAVELRLLLAVDPEVSALADAVAVGERRVQRPQRHAWLAAAGIVLALGLGAVLVQPWLQPPDRVLRGVDVGALEPSPGARLSTAPPRLRWPKVAGVERYHVQLFAEDGRTLWDDEAVTTEIALPETLRASLNKGSYLWQVQPREGGTPALGPYWFEISD